jgi:hypothetical protein
MNRNLVTYNKFGTTAEDLTTELVLERFQGVKKPQLYLKDTQSVGPIFT